MERWSKKVKTEARSKYFYSSLELAKAILAINRSALPIWPNLEIPCNLPFIGNFGSETPPF
jgi:hypothetical protein